MDDKTIKRLAKQEAELDNEYTITFTKRELMIIFHWLAMEDDGTQQGISRKYNIGDGAVLFGVMQKIQPLAKVTPEPEEQNHVHEAPAIDLGEKEVN